MADTKVRVGQLKPGSEGEIVKVVSGAATWAAAGAGSGDVIGPATSADNTIARFDGVDNKTIQGSLATVDDSGGVNIPTGQTYNINGSPHTHAGGTGDVIGPATNTDGNVPQWDGTNSKTLKNGLGLVTTVGNPGSDSNVPSEQGVREAIAASAGADANAIHVNATSEIHGITEKTTPADNDEVVIEDSAAAYAKKRVKKSNLVGGSANHAYFSYLAALQEPLAVEPAKVATFSYAISGSVTKYLIASYKTRIGASGRMEIRFPTIPLALRGVTLEGIGSDSTAAILDPSLGVYTNAYNTYYDRLKQIAETTNLYLAVSGNAIVPFLPGPYGSILTRVVNYGYTGVISFYQANYGLNFTNEIDDATSISFDAPLCLAVSKNIMNEMWGYNVGGGVGSVVYMICPSNWGTVVDSTSYGFRDDFMGASLDTASVWTRAQSTAGFVEIDTAFQWLHMTGNENWGTNGCYTQTFSQTRTAGKILVMDIDVTRVKGVGAGAGLMIAGWSDGGGHSYTNFSHGILFNGDGTIKIYENSNDRGVVGSGFAIGKLYRIRITLDSAGANSAKYEIQGGTEYTAFGGATWTDITPGTTSSSTTPVYPGLTVYTGQFYAGDVRVY